jgi:hypothetical protein
MLAEHEQHWRESGAQRGAQHSVRPPDGSPERDEQHARAGEAASQPPVSRNSAGSRAQLRHQPIYRGQPPTQQIHYENTSCLHLLPAPSSNP